MTEWSKGPIACLDLATRTGFCFGRPGDVKPRCGAVTFGSPGATVGEKLHAFRGWFIDQCAFEKPWALVFEAPLNIGVMHSIGANVNTVRLLIGMAAIAEEAAIDVGIPIIREVNVQDVRRHFTGRARYRSTKEAKEATISRCRALKFDTRDDNAADAYAIWDYAVAVYSPKTAAQRAIDAMTRGVA